MQGFHYEAKQDDIGQPYMYICHRPLHLFRTSPLLLGIIMDQYPGQRPVVVRLESLLGPLTADSPSITVRTGVGGHEKCGTVKRQTQKADLPVPFNMYHIEKPGTRPVYKAVSVSCA